MMFRAKPKDVGSAGGLDVKIKMNLRNTINIILIIVFFTSITLSQDTLWTKNFGGNNNDYGYSGHQTNDGGYIITGFTGSFGDGQLDLWIIKTDSIGNEVWNQTFGGNNNDIGTYIKQTNDGGYIVTGYTNSFGNGLNDVLLLKLNSQGDIEWDQEFGGSNHDDGFIVRQTQDSGYLILGCTYSYGNGGSDIIFIKTDSTGSEEWTQSYGGPLDDYGYSFDFTEDNGYIIVGSSKSYGNGNQDIWIIKTDSLGVEEWNHVYGGIYLDIGNQIKQDDLGNYIVAGLTESYGNGGRDVILLKVENDGSFLWQKTFGSGDTDYSYSFDITEDNGYIIVGTTIQEYGAGNDLWLIKTDIDGNEGWSLRTGGPGNQLGLSVNQTSDGSYFIVGYNSFYSNGDIWALKVSNPPIIVLEDIENQYILEDSNLILSLSANHIYNYEITYFVDTNPSEINYIINDSLLTLTPVTNWNGNTAITVIASDGQYSDTSEFVLTVEPINDPPEYFNLIFPTINDTFSTNPISDCQILFKWHPSVDVDNEVSYQLTIGLEFFGNLFTEVYQNLSDTSFFLNANVLDNLLSGLNLQISELFWYVESTDGEYTIFSDTSQLILTRELLGINDILTIPTEYKLFQNYPNPFNPVTTIFYQLPKSTFVNISIYNITGHLVEILVNEYKNVGSHSIIWNASGIGSGLYFYQIEAGEYRETKKCLILK